MVSGLEMITVGLAEGALLCAGTAQTRGKANNKISFKIEGIMRLSLDSAGDNLTHQ